MRVINLGIMTPKNPKARQAKCGMTHTEIHDQATSTHKHCADCGQFKLLEEFTKQSRGFQGRNSICINCMEPRQYNHRHQPHIKERRREKDRTPKRRRQTRLAFVRRKYGEEAAQIEVRRLAGEPCDICGQTLESRLMAIDHCHTAGVTRGLLCRRCNTILGQVQDDPELLRRLADYLEGVIA